MGGELIVRWYVGIWWKFCYVGCFNVGIKVCFGVLLVDVGFVVIGWEIWLSFVLV